MFLINIGHSWSFQSLSGADGVVLLPSKVSYARLARESPDARTILFDPQLYLSELDVDDCGKACTNLASYPYFGVRGVESYDSSVEKRNEWQSRMREVVREGWTARAPVDESEANEACENAIALQQDLHCSHVILPSPLLKEREDEAQTLGLWLDQGLETAQNLEVEEPLLATIALSESVLSDIAFSELGFLDTIVDQVTARDGIDGVYIVVAQSVSRHPFDSEESVCRCYAYLSKAFSEAGYEYVLVNFADVFGLVCMGLGASGFATAQSHALRRLALPAFNETSGGRAYPHFYSHVSASEFATESDLDRIRDARLLRRIRDITPVSQQLMATLASGGSASTLRAWAESSNNLNAAQTHFLTRVAREQAGLRNLDLGARQEYVEDWLETADATLLLIRQRLGRGNNLKGRSVPAESWIRIVNDIA